MKVVLPITVYAVAAVYRMADGKLVIYSRSFFVSGVDPLTDTEAVNRILDEIKTEDPGLKLLGATCSRVVAQ